jgi:creatinine amidohydrolase
MGYSVFTDTMVDLPWPQVEAAAKRGAAVLLPVGIIEEHGPHLGLGVDTYSAYLVAVQAKQFLAERGVEALITPPQYWGVSPATGIFAGTFSVRPETMQALIVDIVASLAGWGFKQVFTVNWHADLLHVKTLYGAVKEARTASGVDARFIASDFDLRRLHLAGDEEGVLVQQKPPGISMGAGPYLDVHAGSMETAVMVRFFPKGLDTDYIRSLEMTKLTGEDLRDLGKSEELTRALIPDGYFGNPAAYDADAAEKYVAEIAASYARTVADYLGT